MSEQLLDAISAIRNGQTREAQELLTNLLQADPDNEQAWFLLSNIVESDELRAAYLSKTLALNPHHEKARQQLARLKATAQQTTFAAATPEPEPDIYEDDLFSPLAEESEPFDDEVFVSEADEIGVLPDWIDEIEDEPEVEPVAASKELAPPTKTAVPDKKELSYAERDKQMARYNQLLLIIGVLIIITVIFLIINL